MLIRRPLPPPPPTCSQAAASESLPSGVELVIAAGAPEAAQAFLRAEPPPPAGSEASVEAARCLSTLQLALLEAKAQLQEEKPQLQPQYGSTPQSPLAGGGALQAAIRAATAHSAAAGPSGSPGDPELEGAEFGRRRDGQVVRLLWSPSRLAEAKAQRQRRITILRSLYI